MSEDTKNIKVWFVFNKNAIVLSIVCVALAVILTATLFMFVRPKTFEVEFQFDNLLRKHDVVHTYQGVKGSYFHVGVADSEQVVVPQITVTINGKPIVNTKDVVVFVSYVKETSDVVSEIKGKYTRWFCLVSIVPTSEGIYKNYKPVVTYAEILVT